MRKKAVVILNILIVAGTIAGVVMMILGTGKNSMLTTSGVENLKYFTVLSNLFCGIVASAFLIAGCKSKKLLPWKLMAATAVALTFLMIAVFFGPLYGWLKLYQGSNLMFHLIVPVLAIVEFILLDGEFPFRYTFLAGAPALVYGAFYLANILINGTGTWPHSNDWYGFVNWGLGVGIVIFAVVVLTSWGIACLLRWINKKNPRCASKE